MKKLKIEQMWLRIIKNKTKLIKNTYFILIINWKLTLKIHLFNNNKKKTYWEYKKEQNSINLIFN